MKSHVQRNATRVVFTSILCLQRIGVECHYFVYFESRCSLKVLLRIKDLVCFKENRESVSESVLVLECCAELGLPGSMSQPTLTAQLTRKHSSFPSPALFSDP